MREVQYDKKENFYLDLKCGPTQSHIWAVSLKQSLQDSSQKCLVLNNFKG